jgi:hypothetical protein
MRHGSREFDYKQQLALRLESKEPAPTGDSFGSIHAAHGAVAGFHSVFA